MTWYVLCWLCLLVGFFKGTVGGESAPIFTKQVSELCNEMDQNCKGDMHVKITLT